MNDADMRIPKGRLYYYALQNEARKRTTSAFNARIMREPGSIQYFDGLTICSIISPDMPSALDFAANEWPKFYGTNTFQGFSKSWEDIIIPRLSEISAFDLAIWQRMGGADVLAALAFGTLSNAKTQLTIKWVERYQGHTHIAGRALLPILTCAEEYAKLLGCLRVLIKDPISPAKYRRYGYSDYAHPYVRYGGNYLGKELDYGR